MKVALLTCLICSWVVLARAGVLWWGAAPQADEPQSDEDEGTEVLRMVEALSHDLQGMTGQGDAWLTRYQGVAEAVQQNTKLSDDLLSISRMVRPLLWNMFMGNVMMTSMRQINEKGGVAGEFFVTRGTVPPPPPEFLFVYPTELTVDDTFIVQAVVRTSAEANLGFCVYYAPEDGHELDFYNGDILFASHIRWHFDYGNSREIAFNDRYNGVWSRPEKTVGGDQWPDFQVGEKFIISVATHKSCFQVTIILGRDMHMSVPLKQPSIYFCPKHPRTGDPRKLWLAVNEDKIGAGEVHIHWLTWFPMDYTMS